MPTKNKMTRPKWLTAVILLVFVTLSLYLYSLPDTTPPPPAKAPIPQAPHPASTSPIAVYFTSPIIPFDNVTTGGIETNLIFLIDKAQTSIDLAVFEFDLENVTKALVSAHQRGVVVRIVHDNENTSPDPQIKELEKTGIKAVPDKRTAFMHHKFFVFDRQTVWTGSFNITVNAAYKNNENAIVIPSKEIAANYTAEFEKMFSGKFGPNKKGLVLYPTASLDGIILENYFSPEDGVMSKIISKVKTANKAIDFVAFSFTDDGLADAMLSRKTSGVTIRGIFETRGANTDSSECETLLNKGVPVRLDGNPNTLHDKIIIIDGETVITGSFNYSANAEESNDENIIIITNGQIASQFLTEFEKLYANAFTPTGKECKR